jgi:hypothetical protein
MWRDGYPTEPDYNDNEGFCGGFGVSGDPGMANRVTKLGEFLID